MLQCNSEQSSERHHAAKGMKGLAVGGLVNSVSCDVGMVALGASHSLLLVLGGLCFLAERLGSGNHEPVKINPAKKAVEGLPASFCFPPCPCGASPSPTAEAEFNCWWCGRELITSVHSSTIKGHRCQPQRLRLCCGDDNGLIRDGRNQIIPDQISNTLVAQSVKISVQRLQVTRSNQLMEMKLRGHPVNSVESGQGARSNPPLCCSKNEKPILKLVSPCGWLQACSHQIISALKVLYLLLKTRNLALVTRSYQFRLFKLRRDLENSKNRIESLERKRDELLAFGKLLPSPNCKAPGGIRRGHRCWENVKDQARAIARCLHPLVRH